MFALLKFIHLYIFRSSTLLACASPTLSGKMTFRVATSTEANPQRTGRVDIHTDTYTKAACAAGVVAKTTDGDILRYTPTMGPEGCAS